MPILVLPTSSFVQQQLDALRAQAPEEIFHTDPGAAPAATIEAILAFRLPHGIAPRYPNLRFVACAGAGVDEIVRTADLPAVPVVRPVDPLQAQRIAQYVVLMVLRQFRDLPRLERQHRDACWQRFAPAPETAAPVAVLGHGASGRAIAVALQALGFPVRAWHRERSVDDASYVVAGPEALYELFAYARFVVCALPLTRATRGLVNEALLQRLPRGAYVIDVSRGGIVMHEALLAGLASGQIAGAALDVFPDEPLPAHSPLWRDARVLCTPHVAGAPRPEVAAAQFLDNLRRSRRGEALVGVVDRGRGY